jgi:N-formylglutamate amidohydrolase
MALVPDDAAAAALETDSRSAPKPSWSVLAPTEQSCPLVLASPHSGQDYPPKFVAESKLDPLALRRSEDAFVDQIFSAAPRYGVPLLRAHFPRVYLDPNREPFELDPGMFRDPLPDYVNATSPRVAAGLGTVARVVTSGEEIYATKLRFQEVRQRIETHYFPYHQALKNLVDTTHDRFGGCLLVDCHSMPSVGGPMDSDSGIRRVDMVLGDRFGTSCAPAIVDAAERALSAMGYSVRRNLPYAGGYTTRHYGRPREGIHSLQIEVNRVLYMDEDAVTPTDGLALLAQHMSKVIDALTKINVSILRAS